MIMPLKGLTKIEVGWLMTLKTIPACQPRSALISLPCQGLNRPIQGPLTHSIASLIAIGD